MKRKLKIILMKLFRNRIISKKFPNNTISQDTDFWDLFMSIYEEYRAIMSICEMYNIYKLVKNTCKIDGDIAEVGVYKGEVQE